MTAITFSFEKNNGPLYRQLYSFIKSEIKTGNLKAGEKLPSKRMLSAHLKVSQNTIETAYEQLCAEGYLRSVPKSGFFVCRLDEVPQVTDLAPVVHAKEKHPEKQYKYDFKTNTVDTAFFPFATWARLSKEIMHDENRELLKIAHPQGDELLRESIAKYLHEFRGVHCSKEQIVIGAGTEYLLGLIVQILGRGCIYAVENPAYAKTVRILKSGNVGVNLIGLDEEGMKVQELAASNANVAYITPSHHFPLGIVMPVSRRMQMLKWAAEAEDRYIIEDDYDSEFRFNGRPIPALQGLDANEKVIYISTFSKSIAPSMRISYMVLPAKLLKRYRDEFWFYASTVSRFEQYTLYKFIKDGHFERHLNRMRNIYRGRKEKLCELIKKLPMGGCIDIIGENAGLHLLLKVRGPLKEGDLVGRAAEMGVKVYGLSDYYIEKTGDMPDDVVVLGYSNFSEEQLTEAVKLLNEAWFG